MKLHRSIASGVNVVTAYGEDYVMVNGERHASNLIVLPDQVLPWSAASFAALSAEDFAPLAGLGLEIVLLGTGPRLRFPQPSLTRALAEARVGLEVMDLRAACRTYNILVAEERKVAAALLFA
ncbi:MAG TPA: Mth938-like domain-containing protein [Myxococcota bacterium]|nr:Mth938-like domain-containing protein [Myxococcota bacterium]